MELILETVLLFMEMESENGFYSVLKMDAKWVIDPQYLFVGPRIGEGAHAKVYEGK